MSKRELITAELERVGMRRGMYCRSAQIAKREAPAADGGELTKARWILVTEQPVMMFDWRFYEFMPEVLLASGVSAPEQVPLLDNHRRDSFDDMLGSVGDYVLTDVGGVAAVEGEVRFDTRQKAKDAAGMVARGHLKDGSIGYTYEDEDVIYIPKDMTVNVAGKSYVGPVKVVIKSRQIEFSLTPIGADTLAKVKRMIIEDKKNGL